MSDDVRSGADAGYEDLLDGRDASTLRTIQRIAYAYTSVDPTPWLAGPPRRRSPAAARVPQRASAIPDSNGSPAGGRGGLPGHIRALQDNLTPVRQAHSGGHPRWRVRTKLYMALATVLGTLLLVVGSVTNAVERASPITDLGKPTNTLSTSEHFPLSGFHRVSTSLPQGRKPELLFLGASGSYARVSAERWPVVKALDQFGTLTNVKATVQTCPRVVNIGAMCAPPTFDLSHAHYASPYLTFVSKDLIHLVGKKVKPFQPMTPVEHKLYNTYVSPKGPTVCFKEDASGNFVRNAKGQVISFTCKTFTERVEGAINSDGQRTLPLVAIGGYLQTSSQDITSGDFFQTIVLTPPQGQSYSSYNKMLTFDATREGLISGKDPAPGLHLVEDVNGEANIITALICHATGRRPTKVCGRPTIKAILQHVK